jgi:HAD superfamily hydrolase (TIGR01509 family)
MLVAILFDLDGTIANTDPIHYQVWRETLLNYGVEIDEAFYKSRISGKLNPEIIKDILPQLSPVEAENFADEKEAIFRQLASHLQPLPGFTELLAWTKKHNLKRALVTNAPRLNVEFMLSTLGIQTAFDTIVLAEDCAAPKPDPTPYRVALARLGIIANQAIALEDSCPGISAAVGAGIQTVGVASTHEPQTLKAVGAFITIPDFTDLQLWSLLNTYLEKTEVG